MCSNVDYIPIDIPENCLICLDSLYNNNVIKLNCCKNDIHLECFFKWIKSKPSCPICRDEKNIETNLNFLIENDQEEQYDENTTLLRDRPIQRDCNIFHMCCGFFILIVLIYGLLPIHYKDNTH